MERFRATRRFAISSTAVAAVVTAALATGDRVGGPGMSATDDVRSDPYAAERLRMVRDQIERRGVRDPLVLQAMRRVPRHLLVGPQERFRAYQDGPLPIGSGQTISQPYIVAFMTEALRVGTGDRVLEVGTGSGYQAAVLAAIVKEVFTIEIHAELARDARKRLEELGVRNVRIREGDGFHGWPEEAPFDAIIVTAAPASIPRPLLDQLRPGGRLVIPLGPLDAEAQNLVRVTRTADGFERETLLPVRFVPMTGEAQQHD
ncbi:MAG: protein-L-isoaspartate(D-aspartate) O-methyltransferase [Candidatus Polarisedimenticolia bacterium]